MTQCINTVANSKPNMIYKCQHANQQNRAMVYLGGRSYYLTGWYKEGESNSNCTKPAEIYNTMQLIYATTRTYSMNLFNAGLLLVLQNHYLYHNIRLS